MAGGARPGSGRKRALIDEKRLVALVNQGVTLAEIARRFGVTKDAIRWAIKNPTKAVQDHAKDWSSARTWDSGESQG